MHSVLCPRSDLSNADQGDLRPALTGRLFGSAKLTALRAGIRINAFYGAMKPTA